ncbi:MAG: hypothetical protein ACLRMZ_02225 [Blautia marasmi]
MRGSEWTRSIRNQVERLGRAGEKSAYAVPADEMQERLQTEFFLLRRR